MFSCGHVERTSCQRRERLFFSCCHVEEPLFEEEKDFVEVNTATKTKGTNNMDLMESTVKVDMEINFWEQIANNVRQLDEFDAMIFELEYKMVDKNIAIGSRMYELMSKRIEQLKRKIVEVEGGQKEVRRKANEMVY